MTGAGSLVSRNEWLWGYWKEKSLIPMTMASSGTKTSYSQTEAPSKNIQPESVTTLVLSGLIRMDFAQSKAGCAESVESWIILLKFVLLPRIRDKTLDRHEIVSHIQLPNHRFVRSLKINQVPEAMMNTCTHWIKTQRRVRKHAWWMSK